MADNRRRALATAATGYSLVGAGGALRGHAIDEAHQAVAATSRMKPPAGAVYAAHQLRVPRRGVILRRFGLGTALVTIGAPAAAKGTYDLLRRPRPTPSHPVPDEVTKRRRPLVVEGVTGTGQALGEKAESLRSGAPLQVRAIPIATGGAGALTASLAAHRGLDVLSRRGLRIHPTGRAALATVAAVPGALATLPVSRRLTRRTGYQVTPTGVRKAWRKTYEPPDYRGRHTPVSRQRAAIYSAGAIPAGIGAIAGAKVAGTYAPPGQHRRTSVRQFAAGAGAGSVAGVAAAHQLASRVETSPLIAGATGDVHHAAQYVAAAARSRLPKKEPGPRMAAVTARMARARDAVKGSKTLKPFFATPERAIASAVGYSIAKPVVGQLGGAWAMRRNQADQKRYNAHHPIGKAAGVSQRERDQLARRKRTQAVTSVLSGSAGLGALGLLVAAKHPRLAPRATQLEHHRNSILAAGAGISGVGNFNFAGIQRREAKADAAPIRVARRPVLNQERRNQPRSELAKYDRLRTDMHEHEAKRLARQYGGLSGPLPPGLSRDERMRAWEARYVASGGHKAHRWQRAAETSEVVRNAGLVGGAASGAAWLAAGSPRGRAAGRMLARHAPKLRRVSTSGVKHTAERAAVGAATLGASAELAGEYARARRSRYTTAPGGVAASALRRMRAYNPGDNR